MRHVIEVDLGLATVAAVIAAAIWLYARRVWRAAAARSDEVRRLAWLAAEEAAAAEAEAVAISYVAPPVGTSSPIGGDGRGDSRVRIPAVEVMQPPPPPQCAVCYRHTMTRCSRCKAVRYCSGKCQIIHWRQGHKDECHPPKIDNRNNDNGSVSQVKSLQTVKLDLLENSEEIEARIQPKSVGTSSARPSTESTSSSVVFSENDIEAKPFGDVTGTNGIFGSFVYSASLPSDSSAFSGSLETSNDAFTGDNSGAKIEEGTNQDIPPEEPITTIPTNMVNIRKNPHSSAGSSINNLPCTSNIGKEHSSKADVTECSPSVSSGSSSNSTDSRPPEVSGDSKGVHVQKVPGSPYRVPSNSLSSETRAANKDTSCRTASPEVSTKYNHKHSTADKSSSIANGRSTEEWSVKDKSMKPLSHFSSMHNGFSNGGMQFISRDTLTKSDNTSLFTKSVGNTGSVPNGITDLKTSARRVIQQLKPSHLSRHFSSPRSDISQKYKMLFPYDLFVKLYNWDKVEMRPCGLTNCGNSCYANAVLQCLAFTRPLTAYLLQGLHSKICLRRDWCFTCEFESLLVKTKQGQSPLSPSGILSHIQNIGSNLGHGREEDAHEFLRYAIDIMQLGCLKEAGTVAAGSRAEETTLIQLIFGGFLRSKIKCTRCQGKSERNERMMDLTVEINGDIGTLEEALSRFTSTEIMDGENRYHCSRCKSCERAKKKMTVLEAPNVLTIALKRFQPGKFGKLNKAVRFPEILDLAPYMSGTDDKSPVYSLYAVVVHQDVMNAAFSGHYVCYVKSIHGKWYKTDDSKVRPEDIGSVLTKNAYMLFYARCSPRAPSLIRSSISRDYPLSRKFRPNLFNERNPFPRSDSSSDSCSLISGSDEGSCSTESTSTGDSTASAEELSEYIFGDSGRFSAKSSSIFSEDCDGSLSSPSALRRRSFVGEGESLNYGERLGWERSEDLGPQFLYSEMTYDDKCRKLTVDFSDSEEDDAKFNVLSRTLMASSRQAFY